MSAYRETVAPVVLRFKLTRDISTMRRIFIPRRSKVIYQASFLILSVLLKHTRCFFYMFHRPQIYSGGVVVAANAHAVADVACRWILSG